MGKGQDSFVLLANTTGAGIAVGTNVDIGGIFITTAATTVTIVNSAATFTWITTANIPLAIPIAVSGPVTATSSGGTFSIAYRAR